MPRPPRVFYEGAIYHVFARGNRRETIFHEPGHYRRFLRILGHVWADSDFAVLAYCLMPNHFHLAVRAGMRPLGQPMQRVLSTYARSLNREADRRGHVFERRYHALEVAGGRYLQTLIRYIHLNPIRAGIAADPRQYPWSSHEACLGGDGPRWLDRGAVLAAFGAEASEARQRYARFVGHPDDDELAGTIALPRPRGICRDAQPERGAHSGALDDPPMLAADLETLIDAAAELTGISGSRLLHGRDRSASLGRALVASMIQRQCDKGARISEFARRCRCSSSALSNAGRRLRVAADRASLWAEYCREVARRIERA